MRYLLQAVMSQCRFLASSVYITVGLFLLFLRCCLSCCTLALCVCLYSPSLFPLVFVSVYALSLTDLIAFLSVPHRTMSSVGSRCVGGSSQSMLILTDALGTNGTPRGKRGQPLPGVSLRTGPAIRSPNAAQTQLWPDVLSSRL